MKQTICLILLISFLSGLFLPDIVLAKGLKSGGNKIAVLPIEGQGTLKRTEMRRITYVLTNEFQGMQGYDPIEMVLVENILRENNIDLYSCATLYCQTEAANALGVGYIVNGTIERRGTNYILDFRLVDVSDGNITNTVNTVVRGNFRDLQDYMVIVAARLVGTSASERSKSFVLTDNLIQIDQSHTTWIIMGLALASGAGLGMYLLNKNGEAKSSPGGPKVEVALPLPGPPSFP